MAQSLTPRPVRALLRRELSAYFTNPTAYIFITLFVLLSGIAAFWVEAFFSRNLANLDQLNKWFPVLLLFLIPAITMSAWAEERKQGTEELLMTLPASEWRLALGKYLGCTAIYAVCLLFAASHILVLVYLGRPDIGLLVSTYLGYLLAGGALIGLGLFASSLSASGTIAYITGACVCGFMVALYLLTPVLPASIGPTLKSLSIPARMESFGRGVIDPADVAYFVGVAVVGVLLTAGVLRRRRSVGLKQAGATLHGAIRIACTVIIAACAVLVLDRTGGFARADATAERLWTLSPATRSLVGQIPVGNRLRVTAFVSPKTPPSLVQQRETLDGMLRELAANSAGKITVTTKVVEPNTEEARDAERALGIRPRALPSEDGSVGGVQDVFLAVAVESAGGEVATIPFLSKGLPVEYELARAIRSVSTPPERRKRVGILETGAGLYGSFDFQTMSSKPDWPIIAELRKQYTVERISPGAAYPTSIDVLLVAQPSTLNDEQLSLLLTWIGSGKPTLIFEDPLPLINPTIATAEPRQQRSQFDQSDPAPKANLQPLWDLLGAKVASDNVVWDSFNPRPMLKEMAGEFIWATPRKNIGFDPFAQDSSITSGLQEIVLLFGGRIERTDPKVVPPVQGQPTVPPSRTEFKTLIRSGPTSGSMPYPSILRRSFFGGPSLNPERRPTRVGNSQPMAVQLSGGDKKINTVLVGDLDMISDTFFQMREQGAQDMEFDNVPFVLNAVDALIGDQSLVELRKKRRTYRTLERIDARRQAEVEEVQKAEEAARAEAQARLAEANARLEQRVKEVQDRTDLDQQSKEIMMASVQNAEQSRVTAQTVLIEQQRARSMVDARLASKKNIDRIESGVRIAAVALPPVPALLTGLFVMVNRRRAGSAPRAD